MPLGGRQIEYGASDWPRRTPGRVSVCEPLRGRDGHPRQVLGQPVEDADVGEGDVPEFRTVGRSSTIRARIFRRNFRSAFGSPSKCLESLRKNFWFMSCQLRPFQVEVRQVLDFVEGSPVESSPLLCPLRRRDRSQHPGADGTNRPRGHDSPAQVLASIPVETESTFDRLRLPHTPPHTPRRAAAQVDRKHSHPPPPRLGSDVGEGSDAYSCVTRPRQGRVGEKAPRPAETNPPRRHSVAVMPSPLLTMPAGTPIP